MGIRDSLGWSLAPLGRGDLLVIAATIIWSFNAVVVKVAFRSSGPLTYSALRYIVVVLALLLLAHLLDGSLRFPQRDDRWLLLALATSRPDNQPRFTELLAQANAHNIATIAATTPDLVAVGSPCARDKRDPGFDSWSRLQQI